ncbi:sugar transporter SWEET1 [Eurytemora carolleeae]|uniref:sugar transporter SWEET1 n=1 Tax=Eurytemora carolleeae TaxID=1294199 RepID=UPI000C757E5E|nr:sugar transporter SWEET1 [Eurytemora carolleeae]|eukprot:XP_023335070.1 sugar transporter SWEET1-like [Eurytemora affinis]
MGLEDWKDVIGNTATVCAIGMFLSGLEICLKLYKTKTSGDLSPMSFLVGIVMTFVWVNYGILIDDANVINVNGAGFILQSFYIVFFYVYAVNKTNLMKKIILVVLILVSVHVYITYGVNVTQNIGFFAAGLSVAYCGAPLAAINHVIRTKSANTLPFFLILMTTIVTGLWTVYGTILQDSFIKIPNFLGFLIAVLQLSLFFYYPVTTIPPKNSPMMDEVPLILICEPEISQEEKTLKP